MEGEIIPKPEEKSAVPTEGEWVCVSSIARRGERDIAPSPPKKN